LLLPHRAGAASALSIQPAAFEVTSEAALIWVAGQAGAELAIEVGAEETLGTSRRIPVAGLNKNND
jgi:hypothetical protein